MFYVVLSGVGEFGRMGYGKAEHEKMVFGNPELGRMVFGKTGNGLIAHGLMENVFKRVFGKVVYG